MNCLAGELFIHPLYPIPKKSRNMENCMKSCLLFSGGTVMSALVRVRL